MKPKRIFLVRHGESEGNVNKHVYNHKPDYAVCLTEQGEQQAIETGLKLKDFLNGESVGIYCSPYTRTRKTSNLASKDWTNVKFYREDLRLREHEWTGTLIEADKANWERKAGEYSTTFFRFPTGESCADAFNRFCTLWTDWQLEDFQESDFPDNLVVFGHGMMIRVMIMRILRLKVEEFELLANPKNCEYIILDLDTNGSYKLAHDIRRHQKTRRIF